MDEEYTAHSLQLDRRERLTMSGVTEVVSFEENIVILRTGLGTLNVHGRELRLKNLSLEGGQVAVEGQISALIYEEPRLRGGWRQRLFG